VNGGAVSPERRREIVGALRRGTVPQRGLEALAVGLERLGPAIDEELAAVARGGAGFKAIRGEYGSGKTFATRWIAERAKRLGFAVSEVQISETETPLHRLETVYRRMIERLSTAETETGALTAVVDGWFFALEEDAITDRGVDPNDSDALVEASSDLMELRLADITRTAPAFAAVLRAYRRAAAAGDRELAHGLMAWLGGQPNVAASVKRAAGLRGDIDHFGALSFVQGLLVALRDSGRSGLVLVLDEVETLQRVRSDVRDKGLNALRQLVDELDGGRFPGLYVVITGTPAFFEGPQGITRLPPLAQRLHTDFANAEPRFDNPRAVQVRLPGFGTEALQEVGRRVRDIYADGASAPARVREVCDDRYVASLADAVVGDLGGRVGIAPRLFLKKLVGEVLDRIDQFPDFDPRAHYALTLADGELTDVERNARAAHPDDVAIDL